MSEARAILRHSSVYALGALLSRGAAFVLIPLYTQFLAAAEYGILGVVTVTSEVVGAVIGVKLGAAVSRIYFDHEQEKDRAEVVTSAILGLSAIIVLALPLFLVTSNLLALVILGNAEQGNLIFIGIVALLLNVVYTLGVQYLVIRKRSGLMVAVSGVRSVVFLGVTAVLVAVLEMGVLGALLGLLITNAVAVLGLVVPLLARLGFRFSARKFRVLVGFGAALLPAQIAELLVGFSDRVLLVHLASLASAGLYFLGLRLTSILQALLIAPFNQIFIVRRFESMQRGADDSDATRVFTYFFLLIVTGALGLGILAPEILRIVAFRRPAYYGTSAIVPLLALSQVMLSVVLIEELGILYAKLPRRISIATGIMLVVHVALNVILIPLFGLFGAACAHCASMACRLAVTIRLAHGLGAPRPHRGDLLRILFVALLCYGLGQMAEVAWGGATSVAARVALAALFPVVMLLSPVFSSEERRLLCRLPARVLSRMGAAVPADGAGSSDVT